MLIFLTILKIIGIVLLSILGLALVIILLVLFVPFRFKIYAQKSMDEEDPYNVSIYITYLLHLFNALIKYPSEEKFRVRIAFFKILPKEEGKVKKKKDKVVKDTKKKKKDDPLTENENTEDEHEDGWEEATNFEEKVDELSDKALKLIDEELDSEPTVKDFIRKIADFLKHFKEKIISIINKIREIISNISYYINIINSSEFSDAFTLCKDELLYLLKKLRIRKIKGYVNYGSTEPDDCARVFGYYSVLAPLLGNTFVFNPCFEEDIFEGEIYLYLRIRIITLVVILAKLYFNKNLKKVIKLLKKEA